jgi:sensor histidine kinase YesM
MKDLIASGSAVVVLLGFVGFVFAVLMQPIFVWIICARLKRTNKLLERIASDRYKALK